MHFEDGEKYSFLCTTLFKKDFGGGEGQIVRELTTILFECIAKCL